MNTITIVLGSTSTHKLEALTEACADLNLPATVRAIKTESGQNAQPVGFEETYGGALSRAQAVRAAQPGSIAVGVESGIFRFGEGITLDIAVIVVLSGSREIVTTSEGVRFPENLVRIAEERGFGTTTVGDVITGVLGGDPTDPHSTLTHGTTSRATILRNALRTALSQL